MFQFGTLLGDCKMGVKPFKPNESGGIKTGTGVKTSSSGTGIKPRMSTGLPPLIKANVRNASKGGGAKIKALRANGGLGNGNNLNVVGKNILNRVKGRVK